uniref:Uncharacterized protein n=1 Tax=Arundo donax TaxID=35708 RepID=A0A0A9A3X4_ARUDO
MHVHLAVELLMHVYVCPLRHSSDVFIL